MEEIWKEGLQFGWGGLKEYSQEYIREFINNLILTELEMFVGCGKYARTKDRKTYRNGHYERLIGTTLGEIKIRYPRLRSSGFESRFIKKYARRQQELDFAVLSCFLLGGSTRKTAKVCAAFTDIGISHSAASNIFKKLDQKAREFHARPIDKKYRFLMLDGLWNKVKGKYIKKTVVLFAMGITADGEKEILDFMQADGETEDAYVALLNHLLKKGLDLDALELVIHDGAKGITAALNLCLPYTERQYCIFHKIQGIAQRLNYKLNRKTIMQDARNIYKPAKSRNEAIENLRTFARKWRREEPRAVAFMQVNFDKTLAYFNYPRELWRFIRTNNRLERSLREIRRRTRPMGPFQNDRSANRIVYSLVYLTNSGELPR
jgi:transposase-like protein